MISIPGYTEREKLEIAKRYLIKRQLEENGLKPDQCEFDEDALRRIINDYTHELAYANWSGRSLPCVVASRRKSRAEKPTRDRHATSSGGNAWTGKYVRETRLKTSKPGVVTGLAYTPAGGEVLHIEATRYPGKGNVTLTGQIKMYEGIRAGSV